MLSFNFSNRILIAVLIEVIGYLLIWAYIESGKFRRYFILTSLYYYSAAATIRR